MRTLVLSQRRLESLLSTLVVGAVVSGQVKARLAQNRYVVSFHDQEVIAESEQFLKTGTRVRAKVVSLKPRVMLKLQPSLSEITADLEALMRDVANKDEKLAKLPRYPEPSLGKLLENGRQMEKLLEAQMVPELIWQNLAALLKNLYIDFDQLRNFDVVLTREWLKRRRESGSAEFVRLYQSIEKKALDNRAPAILTRLAKEIKDLCLNLCCEEIAWQNLWRHSDNIGCFQLPILFNNEMLDTRVFIKNGQDSRVRSGRFDFQLQDSLKTIYFTQSSNQEIFCMKSRLTLLPIGEELLKAVKDLGYVVQEGFPAVSNSLLEPAIPVSFERGEELDFLA